MCDFTLHIANWLLPTPVNKWFACTTLTHKFDITLSGGMKLNFKLEKETNLLDFFMWFRHKVVYEI